MQQTTQNIVPLKQLFIYPQSLKLGVYFHSKWDLMHLSSISLGAAFLPALSALNITDIAALTWELFRGSSFLWGWLRAGLVILPGTLREKEGLPISLTSKHETYTLPLQPHLLNKGSHVDSPDENKDKWIP